MQHHKGGRPRVYFGWWIAWAGCWLYFLNALAFTYGYSLFVDPWSQEFGWSRAAISAVWSATLGVGLISALPAGWAIDRWGPRAVALVSVPFVAAGWAGITLVSDYAAFLILFAGAVGLGMQPAFVMAGQAAVTRWFTRSRAQAFAVLSTGAGLAGLIGVPAFSWLLATLGWRTSAWLLAALVLCLGGGLSLLLRPAPTSPEPVGDGPPAARSPTEPERFRVPAWLRRIEPPSGSFTPAQARRSGSFWLLMIVYVTRFVGMGVVTLHLVPYLQTQGVAATVAGGALGLGLAISLPGRAIFGWLADRLATAWVLAVCLVFQALSLVAVLSGAGGGALIFFAVCWGLGLGSESLIHSIRADYFGQRFFGTISGYFTWPQMIGRMSGALAGGLIYDLAGGYAPAFVLATLLYLASAVTALTMRRPAEPGPDGAPPTPRRVATLRRP